MRIFADLHIHSRFSRATSLNMNLRSISYYAKIKGLDLVGTGDITHPEWRREVAEILEPIDDSGLYALKEGPHPDIRFMISAEVATVYVKGGRSRRIHHVVLLPTLEVASQASDSLSKFGELDVDARPVLKLSSPELVEVLREISGDIEIFPAHAWTPWWSILGSISGFDSLEECYEDQVKNIHALETGLSSDPPMNWRLSSLDRYTLLSNSDSHSPYPYRLGREANIFELPKLTYNNILTAIRRKDPKVLIKTVETRPEYGKYHWTGHRACGISMCPAEALEIQSRCPRCGRPMTKGVEQRVEQLADRPSGYVPEGVPGFVHLLPLHELLSVVLGEKSLFTKRIQAIYDRLITAFGDEFTVMLEAPIEGISKIADVEVASAIESLREDRVKVIPGYDGVYGRIEIPGVGRRVKRTLDDY